MRWRHGGRLALVLLLAAAPCAARKGNLGPTFGFDRRSAHEKLRMPEVEYNTAWIRGPGVQGIGRAEIWDFVPAIGF